MRQLKFAYLAMAVALVPQLSSCTSDANPFDITVTPGVSESAKVLLNLDVAATRAEGDFSTEQEKAISKVNIYVFNEGGKLEQSKLDIDVIESSVEIEVKPGMKTLYAVSSKSVLVDPVADGTDIAEFEKIVFSSKLADLITDDGFVMVGKSDSKYVERPKNEDDQPSEFDIRMIRLVAKTQVRMADDIDASDFGFTIGKASFRVSQTADKMRLTPDYVADVLTEYTTNVNKNGTYDGYTLAPTSEFAAVVATDFTADGCQYMSENIVMKPVAGNTTFVSLRVPFTPDFYFSYDDKLATTDNAGEEGTTFYAVGVVDSDYGFEDLAIDPASKHVVVFQTEEEAGKYAAALNGGDASAMTVSESESALRAPAVRAGEAKQFSVVEFDGGNAYYRINITDNGKLMVERNKFYRISVNSVLNLGLHSEELLVPKEPDSNPDNVTSALIHATLNVVEWEEVNQDVDL